MAESWPQNLEDLKTRFLSNQPRRGDLDEEQKKSNKPKTRRKISSDGLVFKLHYQFTATFLLASALILATNLGLGSPISCYGDSLGMSKQDLAAFCVNYGVRIHRSEGLGSKPEDSAYNLWYKWTPIILVIQSVLFYIPHWLWKHLENGWVDAMIQDLRRSDITDASVVNERKQLTAECLRKGKSNNKLYGLSLIICELLNLANVSLQVLLLNWVFNQYFALNPLSAGKIVGQSYTNRYDPLEQAFPKSISCPRKTFGPSGTAMTTDMLCDVAVNHYNEMCVIILWYWLLVLLPITFLSFLATCLIPVTPFFVKCHLRNSYKGITPAMWNKIFRHLGPFDLLVLKTMLDEMYPKMAEDFLTELALQISPKVDRETPNVIVTSV